MREELLGRYENRTRDGTCTNPQGRPTTVIAAALLLVLAVAIVFVQTARHEFVNFDDDRYVYDNPHITGGLNFKAVYWVMFYRHSHNWHPLTGLTHLIDWQIYRDFAPGHHITSVVLHGITVVLLMLVLRRLTGRLWPSVLTAALFAIHPLRAESVAWVAERKDVLSGFFFMLTLFAYERYARGKLGHAGPDPSRFPLVVVFFICGLMSKPMMVTVPFVLLLLDYWPLRRMRGGGRSAERGEWSVDRERKPINLEPTDSASSNPSLTTLDASPKTIHAPPLRLLIEKIPLFILSAASCGLTVFVQADAIQSVKSVSWTSRFGNAMIAYAEYLGVFFCPRRLAVMYPHPTTQIDLNLAIKCGIGILLISAVAVVLARRWPVLIIGWLWYLGMLVPVIQIVQVGGAAMADRYTYLPQIGIAMAVVWSCDALVAWLRCKAFAAIVASGIIALLIVCAWRQTTFWRDSESLWTRDLSMYGARNAVANYNLGMTLYEKGRNEEAIALYRNALAASPDDADTHINLGLAQAAVGRDDDAIASYTKAIDLNSESWQAHEKLGLLLHNRGNMAESVTQLRFAIDLKISQDHEELPDILRTCAWILATTPDDKLRDPAEALELAKRAAQATGDADPVVVDTLAAAYAAAGRFKEAIAQDQRAIDGIEGKNRGNDAFIREITRRIADHAGNARFDEATARDRKELRKYQEYKESNITLIETIRKRIALYESGKPFRDAK